MTTFFSSEALKHQRKKNENKKMKMVGVTDKLTDQQDYGVDVDRP